MDYQPQEEESNVNIVHIVLYTFLVIALGVSLFFNYSLLNDSKMQTQEEVISQEEVLCETLSDLPQYISAKYVEKNQLELLQTSLSSLETENETLKKQLSDKESVVVVEEKMEKVQKTLKVKDFAKCYNMDEGSYAITKECKQNIIHYVAKHKDAQYFEIIPVIDDLEFKLYKQLELNSFIYPKLGVTQKKINDMKKFTKIGLAKKRAIEATWVIATHTKHKAKTHTTNYEITSTKGKRGVIVRAYK